MLIVIWHLLRTKNDCEWDSSTTNFTRHLMRAKKQNLLFVADLMTWDPTIMGKPKRCVYGLGFGRKRPNPRPSPNKTVNAHFYFLAYFSRHFRSGHNLLYIPFFTSCHLSCLQVTGFWQLFLMWMTTISFFWRNYLLIIKPPNLGCIIPPSLDFW